MWTRSELKDYAKGFLKKHYWKAFIVCLIATLLSGGGSSNSSSNNNTNQDTYYSKDYTVIEEFEDKVSFEFDSPLLNFIAKNLRSSPLFMIGGGIIPIMMLVFVILLITVGFAIEVGRSRFFLEGFKGDVSIGKLFSTFNSEEYLPIVKTIFLRNLYNILWTFLLLIPGIIKYYEYRLVPYILAEKQNLTSNEVISKSREMTSGHKMDMFVLDLSFIGWYLLGGLFFGIGVFFVDPYAEATYARLYNVLARNDDGDNYAEIGLVDY